MLKHAIAKPDGPKGNFAKMKIKYGFRFLWVDYCYFFLPILESSFDTDFFPA